MPKFKTREYISEYNGMKEVVKTTHTNGSVVYHTIETSFVDLANSLGANKLNVSDNEFGLYLHLYTLNNEAVGMYKMTPRLRGFSIQQLVDQHRRLFVCKVYNRDRKMWESYIDGKLVKADIYKEGCGLATILKDDKWSVIDGNNNEVVPSGKYDFMDGFDKCGLARVRINGEIEFSNPDNNTCDKWGIIDTKGNEILPPIYSYIFDFYNKNQRHAKIYKYLEDDVSDFYTGGVIEYRFEFDSRKLIDVEAEAYDRARLDNIYYNYSMWNAFEDSEEAAAAADFEW